MPSDPLARFPLSVTAAILAGGLSRRMGADKSSVVLGGRPLISWVLDHARTVSQDVLVVCRSLEQALAWRAEPALAGVRLVVDQVPDRGPLGGVVTALIETRGTHVLVLAVDAPFAVPAVTRRLIDLGPRAPVIVPRWDGQLHPLHALYARDACRAHLQAELNRGHLKLVRAIDALQPHVVSEAELRALDPEGRSFFNLNSPEDLAQARRLMPDA